ncbi:MAG TPA: ACT domain-containing protein, partial [Deltaproteobacteria bacterium]|nr:ACT domain-containing protein [Deltaproteobacteria bacterium]
MHRMLYVVYGIGADEVGLVGAITSPIASVRGNIVDMHQDVMHGLFTIYMLVDLSAATVSVKEFKSIVEQISAGTGLRLSVERYTPTARS